MGVNTKNVLVTTVKEKPRRKKLLKIVIIPRKADLVFNCIKQDVVWIPVESWMKILTRSFFWNLISQLGSAVSWVTLFIYDFVRGDLKEVLLFCGVLMWWLDNYTYNCVIIPGSRLLCWLWYTGTLRIRIYRFYWIEISELIYIVFSKDIFPVFNFARVSQCSRLGYWFVYLYRLKLQHYSFHKLGCCSVNT